MPEPHETGEKMTGSGMTNEEHQDPHKPDRPAHELISPRSLVWSVAVLFLCGVFVGGANLLFTASQVNAAQTRTLAACAFWQDLAVLPLMNAPNGYPSELAVSIVAHSREAYRGFGCPGKLPAPAPSFVRGAEHYGIDSR